MALPPHLDLEQGGVLVLVALAALVAGEHGLSVQTSGGGHLCKTFRLAISHTWFRIQIINGFSALSYE